MSRLLQKKCQRGGFLIEALIAVGMLVAIVTAFLSVEIFIFNAIRKTATDLDEAVVSSELIPMSRDLLLAVSDGALRTQGICSMVEVESIVGPTVDLYLVFSNDKIDGVFGDDRWKEFLSHDWEIVPMSPRCDSWFQEGVHDDFYRCLRRDSDEGAMDALIEFIPVHLVKEEGVNNHMDPILILGGVPGDKYHLNRVGFNLFVTAQKSDGDSSRQLRWGEMIWAGQAARCDHGGNEIFLQSGGLVPISENQKLGVSVVQELAAIDPLAPRQFENQAIQQGILSGANDIRSDADANVQVGCNEMSYRCPNSTANRNFADGFDVTASFQYNPSNQCFKNTSAPLIPNFGVHQGGTAENKIPGSATVSYRLDQVNYGMSLGKFFALDSSENLTKNEMSVGSQHLMTITVNDQASGSLLCQQICQAVQSGDPHHRGRLELTVPLKCGAETEWSTQLHTQPIACTACYARSCSRFGLDTFGPVSAQPSEPIDGTVPECVLNDIGLAELRHYGENTTASSECMAAQYDGAAAAGNRFTLVHKPCSETKPVLCFNYGRFLLSKDVFGGGGSYYQTDFPGGSRVCYEMGRQRLGLANWEEMFDQMQLTAPILPELPPGSGHLEIINNSEQGLFMAPQTSSQWLGLEDWFVAESPGVTEFWVALRPDMQGQILGVPPMMSSEDQEAERHAVHFDPTGLPEVMSSPGFFSGLDRTGTGGAVLSHHFRYKGVSSVSPIQPVSLKFLCRNSDGDFFVSTAGHTHFVQGKTICQNEGGVFLPPTTPLGWASALHLVNPLGAGSHLPDSSNPLPHVFVAYDPETRSLPTVLGMTSKIGDITLAAATTNLVNKWGAYLEPLPPATPPDPDPHKMCLHNAKQTLRLRAGDCNANEQVYPIARLADSLVDQVMWFMEVRSLNDEVRIRIQ